MQGISTKSLLGIGVATIAFALLPWTELRLVARDSRAPTQENLRAEFARVSAMCGRDPNEAPWTLNKGDELGYSQYFKLPDDEPSFVRDCRTALENAGWTIKDVKEGQRGRIDSLKFCKGRLSTRLDFNRSDSDNTYGLWLVWTSNRSSSSYLCE